MVRLRRKNCIVRDITDYLDTLREMRDRDLADTLTIALHIRKNLLGLGKGDLMLPWEAVSHHPDLPLELDQAIRHWHSQGDLFSMTRASGAAVWLHSLRAVTYPGIRSRACELWGELARGFPHLNERVTYPRGLHPSGADQDSMRPSPQRALTRIFARVRAQQPALWMNATTGPSCAS